MKNIAIDDNFQFFLNNNIDNIWSNFKLLIFYNCSLCHTIKSMTDQLKKNELNSAKQI